MGFSRQNYWSGLPCPSAVDFPHPGIEPTPHVSCNGRHFLYHLGSQMAFQAIVLKWILISFSRGSSQPRAQTRVSHIVDRCFTIWATREVLKFQWSFLFIPPLIHEADLICVIKLKLYRLCDLPEASALVTKTNRFWSWVDLTKSQAGSS